MGAMHRARLHAAALCLSLLAPAWSAAQEPTEPERLYEQLNESEEPGSGPLAERWRVLVRQRVWSDKSGKFKVYARYVDHDPDFKSVTLLILQKKGDQQSFKQSTIPLDKLGKSEQALVKRIAQVRKEVEAMLAAGPSDAGEPGEPGESRETAGEVEPPPLGEGRTSAGLEGLLIDGQAVEGQSLEGMERQVFSGDPAAQYGRRRQTAPEAVAPSATMRSEPWRTDFASLAAELSSSYDSSGKPKASFGSLAQLQAVYELERNLAESRKKPAAERPPQAALVQQAMACGWARGGLGPVVWEVTLTAPVAGPGAKIEHDLAPPEPFSVTLIADSARAESFREIAVGTPVRLMGYFTSLGGGAEKPELVLRVRPFEGGDDTAVRRP
ncbi:MAG: hypothetical protein DCC67_05175 [Planctomycetota bacterium]|nr:MAG: hypothetical protein DCC67_05175 [Planctomycetota bacterium]